MLSVLPLRDEQKIQDFLSIVPLEKEYDTIYLMDDGVQLVGYFTVKQKDEELWIQEIVVKGCEGYHEMSQEESELFEMMVRSAASYALNRNILTVVCTLEEASPKLAALGFTVQEGQWKIDINQLFHTCACGNHGGTK